VELGSCALVLAAQQVMCTIPLLIVLAATRPAGTAGNFGDQLGRYLGLSAKARRELASVFAGPAQVRSAATLAGIVLLAIFTVGVAQAHERAYELAWRVDHRAAGAWRRQARWVAALAGYVARSSPP
jgi:hypothetical protein